MIATKPRFIITFLILFLTIHVSSQKIVSLPRSVPEAEGVSSDSIIKFLEATKKSKNEFHSFMFLRHGKVIAEGWWNPYRPDLKHTMYSTSKSFTSSAIGFAVNEKLLTVNDKVISFFPDDLPDTISSYLSALRIRDLLSMSAGQEPDPTFAVVIRDSNWVRSFLATPIIHEPGTKFLYNTLATYMLSAIIQKVTGQKVIDYLRPRLFTPLAIQGMDWEVDAMGINTGGWGLRIKSEDMAKFGQLYLQKGKWKGKQILPEEWIEEATTSKIEQNPTWVPAGTEKDSSDWLQGYGYQFWRCRNNAYRADGAYGQFIIVMPEKDAVVVLTSEAPDMQDEINLVWKYLLPAMHDDKLTINKNKQARLKQKLSSLKLQPPVKSPLSPSSLQISGKTFSIIPNEKNVKNMSFSLQDNILNLTISQDTSVYKLSFGPGKWKTGVSARKGPYLLSEAKANFVGLPPFIIAGSYSWKNENTLELTLRYIESPHTEKITFQFDGENIVAEIQHSNSPENKIELKGELND